MKLADYIDELDKYITDAKEADNPDNVFSGITESVIATIKNWVRDIPFSEKQTEFASALYEELTKINKQDDKDENQKYLQAIPKYEETINQYKEWFKEGYKSGTIKQGSIMFFKRDFWKNPSQSLEAGSGTRFFEMINRHLAEFKQSAAHALKCSR
jgi:hypothetical protein